MISTRICHDRGAHVKIESARMPGVRAFAVACVALVAVGLAGCGDGVSSVDRAQAQVTAKEKAVAEAESDFAAASEAFCASAETYILALDVYGDVLTDTAPTVGDVRNAGADLVEPRDAALGDVDAAVAAQDALVVAQQELIDAQKALAAAEAGPSGTPDEVDAEEPAAEPLAPAATVDRVKRAESEFAEAEGAITDDTPLVAASESFNSAVVALELSWLRLLIDAGCVTDEQEQQAAAAVTEYTTALQQDLADAGFYDGEIDGIYGPGTVAAVEELQKANDLPVTGTVDRATAAALQAALVAAGGAEAHESVATTAALQQTLALLGFWDGPVDGTWTPELTEALEEFQEKLGVEPTGEVDAETLAAFEEALSELKQLVSPTPTPEPSSTEEP